LVGESKADLAGPGVGIVLTAGKSSLWRQNQKGAAPQSLFALKGREGFFRGMRYFGKGALGGYLGRV